METDEKLSLEQILGKQTKALINNYGIHNLRVEEDGSISGERPNPEGFSAIQVHNISLCVRRDRLRYGTYRIMINEDWGKIKRSIIDIPSGKII